jgi:N-sulfoglucosamine sulfohydrolase
MNISSIVIPACLALSVALSSSAAHAGEARRPHIVVFLSDDHGQEFAGCYGNKVIQTPNLDRLAKEGMRCTHVFAASPTCAPSRAVLYTGLHSPRNGAMGNHTSSRKDILALPAYLRAQGYRVVLANKVHVAPATVFDFEILKATLPKDANNPRKYRAEGLDTRAVDRFLAAHARERPKQPLCLILADSGPHVTWERNRIYDPAKLPIPPYLVDTPTTRAGLANYYQDITSVDQRLGEVLESLKRHGFEEDTLFIYTSDQGAEWPRCKWTLYDTGLRVPFVARWPGRVRPGSVSDALISFVDVTPTLIDVAGGKPVKDLDGRSFRDVLLAKVKTFNERVYACHTGDGEMNQFPQRSVRDTRYLYLHNLRPEREWTTHFTKVPGIPDSHKEVWDSWLAKAKTDPKAAKLIDLIVRHPREELYDTHADPHQLNNLAADPRHRTTLERMRIELRRWRQAQGDLEE